MSKNTSCCEDVTVTIDCTNAKDGSAYPNNVPKPPNGCKQVNTGPRLKGDKIEIFRKYYNNNLLPKDKAEAIAHSLGLKYEDVKKMDGSKIYDTVKNANKIGDDIEYHHIWPDWSGGDNTGDNLVPILRTLHTGDGSAHRWWGRKLADKNSDIQKKIEDCLKKNGNKKTYTHKNGEAEMKETARFLHKERIEFTICLKNCNQ